MATEQEPGEGKAHLVAFVILAIVALVAYFSLRPIK